MIINYPNYCNYIVTPVYRPPLMVHAKLSQYSTVSIGRLCVELLTTCSLVGSDGVRGGFQQIGGLARPTLDSPG